MEGETNERARQPKPIYTYYHLGQLTFRLLKAFTIIAGRSPLPLDHHHHHVNVTEEVRFKESEHLLEYTLKYMTLTEW